MTIYPPVEFMKQALLAPAADAIISSVLATRDSEFPLLPPSIVGVDGLLESDRQNLTALSGGCAGVL